MKNIWKIFQVTSKVLLVFFLLVIVFDAIVMWLAVNEGDQPPARGGDWVTKTQIHDPPNREPCQTAILVHGFVGSPFDYRPLVQPLLDNGLRVVIPIVPGQNRMETLSARDSAEPAELVEWLKQIIASEHEKSGTKPILMGLSMGGTLAVIIANDESIDRLVLFAPYFSLPSANRVVTFIGTVLQWVIPFVPKSSRGKINDRSGYDEYEPGTRFLSVKAFVRLQELAAIAKDVDLTAEIPILVIQSPNDSVAAYDIAHSFFGAGSRVEFLDVPASDHILLYDADREEIISKVVQFVSAEKLR